MAPAPPPLKETLSGYLDSSLWEDSPAGFSSSSSSQAGNSSSSAQLTSQQQQQQQQPSFSPFDRMNHAQASPSAFSSQQFNSDFVPPRFATGGPGDTFGYGVSITEPDTAHHHSQQLFDSQQQGQPQPMGSYEHQYSVHPSRSLYQSFSPHQIYARAENHPHSFPAADRPGRFPSSASGSNSNSNHNSNDGSRSSSSNFNSASASGSSSGNVSGTASIYNRPPQPNRTANQQAGTAIYAPYGSSVLNVNSSQQNSSLIGSATYKGQTLVDGSADSSVRFDPAALGLPVPPPAGKSTNFAGLYSSSGFDMLSVLARVASRPNPQINIGPVDTGCSFLVVDAKRFDMPIVYASATFSRLTGYTNEECLGRNCRFLQSPTGQQEQGAPRSFTDGSAAWHMRTHIGSGKENQTSLINFKKGGQPFINLVTVIPITWDSDEIAYYVGFQVDLVDQPNAILDRMKGGTYVVNYSLFDQPPKQIDMQSIEIKDDDDMAWADETISPQLASKNQLQPPPPPSSTAQPAPSENVIPTVKPKSDAALLEIVIKSGLGGLEQDDERRSFHKMLLNECSDFVHVLSLKGSFLYCSPSTSRILEYEPAELIGKTLPALCHPSDVVPVMRLLKDTSTMANPTVSLLYRIRRQRSGYLWIECSGKLHIEPGKGRKCVIFVGRPKEVLKMSWQELRTAGGIGELEWWSKLSTNGVILSSTSAVQSVTGHSIEHFAGRSFLELSSDAESSEELKQAIARCQEGESTSVEHAIDCPRGKLQVVTRFYSRSGVNEMDEAAGPGVPSHVSILAQTNELGSDRRKNDGRFVDRAPEYHQPADGDPAQDGVEGSPPPSSSASDSSNSSFASAFKSLVHPSQTNDNVFDELDTTRCTSWQYELHQLQNSNKRLREERDTLLQLARRRRSQLSAGAAWAKRRESGAAGAAHSPGSEPGAGGGATRSCANCGTTSSVEWRTGPTGPKTLCNACSLRWNKERHANSAAIAAAAASAAALRDEHDDLDSKMGIDLVAEASTASWPPGP